MRGKLSVHVVIVVLLASVAACSDRDKLAAEAAERRAAEAEKRLADSEKSAAEAESRAADASEAYWRTFRDLSLQFDQLQKQFDGDKKDSGQVEKMMKLATDESHKLALAIRQIPVTDVDPDIIALSSDTVLMLESAASVFSDFANLLARNDALEARGRSWGTQLESAARGFFGDPFHTADEFSADQKALEDQHEAILSRYRQLEIQMNEMDARELRLRQSLSARYHRDFPSLD